jgi:hypothetical protein
VSRTPQDYFERLYRQDPDPWGFESRWYESRKYALTLAALPRPRYRSAFEPGCSIGVLMARLADRCDRLLAADGVEPALEQARLLLIGQNHVSVTRLLIPEEWPCGPFDLIVLSEIGYYFDEPDLRRCCEAVARSLEPAGNLVAVHWRGVTDYPLSGDDVHRIISTQDHLSRVVHHEEADFLLDVWERTGA